MEGFVENNIEFPKDGIPLDRISSDLDKKILKIKFALYVLTLYGTLLIAQNVKIYFVNIV